MKRRTEVRRDRSQRLEEFNESGAVVLMIPQESFRHVLQQDEGFAVRVNILITSRRSAPTSVPA